MVLFGPAFVVTVMVSMVWMSMGYSMGMPLVVNEMSMGIKILTVVISSNFSNYVR
jgi:hypothetical protein